MSGSHMEAYWDERAREDAYYFVDSRLAYGSPDTDAFWAGGRDSLKRLFAAVDAPPLTGSEVVVDIGCGLGRLTRPLAEASARVVAFDVSNEMLERARELNTGLTNVEWVHSDGTSLRPLEDASVDVCVSHVVFRHLPDPELTLGYVREMGRVLRPGGWAAFEFSNDPNRHRGGKPPLLRRAAAALRRGPRATDDPAWVGSAVALEDLQSVAASVGLAQRQVSGEGSEFCAVLLERS